MASAPSIVHDVLRSPGRPLDPAARTFMEPRFGHDFGRVRVHTDETAAESARAVSALAYTVGHDIVFAPGQYSPMTAQGRKLLAHELTHVTQQEGPGKAVQRITEEEAKCPGYIGDAEVATSRTEKGHLATDAFPFPTGSENLLVADFGVDWRHVKDSTRDDAALKSRLAALEDDTIPKLTLLGFSDCVAGERYNVHLRQGRARNVFNLLGPKARARAVADAAPKGEYLVGNDTVDNRALNRSVLIIREKGSKPKPDTKANVCGPDITQWFIDQVSSAKASQEILRIKQDFIQGNSIMASLGLPDIRLLAEYFVDEKVTQAWEAAGKPVETGEAKGERLSAFSGFAALAQAELKVANFGVIELAQLAKAKDMLKDAALTWMALVQDKAKYDFKNNVLKNPHSKDCPVDCKSTLTLCDMCFLTDVPGNIFYAHVGRFAGWTDLALRLGSQYAQLISKKTWDPPEDSAILTIGLGLPDPLTTAALCSALRSDGSRFTKPCASCGEPMQT
jgi:hypothetical protein